MTHYPTTLIASHNPNALRPDLRVIADHILQNPRERVIDVGCGDGSLIAALAEESGIDVRGMEIDAELVERCVSRGLSVVQGDANRDLADYPDKAFDYAILSQTLQTAQRPDWLLEQLLRIGKEAFVSFPNFAYWRMRLSLLRNGRMPVTPHLPISWYETPNIHHLTIADFRSFVAEREVMIKGEWFFAKGREISGRNANMRAEHAVFQLSR